jgi:hypothetical protein
VAGYLRPPSITLKRFRISGAVLALFLRKAKRNADVARLIDEVTGRDKTEQ